jgi:hypothetical protein
MYDWNRTIVDLYDLDNHITGHYGEDQFGDEDNDFCPECGNFTEFLNEFGMGLCATHAMRDSEDY